MTDEILATLAPPWAELLTGLPAGVRIAAQPGVAMLDVRLDAGGPAATDVARQLGVALPVPSTWVAGDHVRVIWLGPDEWLVTSSARTSGELEAGLREAVAGRGAVVDVSGQRTAVRLSGEHARDLLAGGCSLDLHPRVFVPGSAVQTALGRTGIVLLALEDGSADARTASSARYDILVRRSFAGYLAAWLHDASVEYR